MNIEYLCSAQPFQRSRINRLKYGMRETFRLKVQSLSSGFDALEKTPLGTQRSQASGLGGATRRHRDVLLMHM